MKKIIVIIVLIFVAMYLYFFKTPLYEGKLVIDVNNISYTQIEGLKLFFEKSDKNITIPSIKPFERIILIAPSDVFDEPVRTQVFIEYKDKKYCILGEYHSVNGGNYNLDVKQMCKIAISKTKIVNKYNGALFGLLDVISFKPYMRIIQLE